MKEFSITDARQDLPSIIRKSQKEPIVVTKHGKPESVIISYEMYEEFIEAVEELDDIEAADLSIKDKDPAIPWEKVKKELGLI